MRISGREADAGIAVLCVLEFASFLFVGEGTGSITALQLQLRQIDERLGRLTDAYIDRLIDKDLFEQRKGALLSERAGTEEKLKEWQSGRMTMSGLLAKFLERADTACLAYQHGKTNEKRDLVDSLTSNRTVEQKTLEIMLTFPFNDVANRAQMTNGSATGNRTPI